MIEVVKGELAITILMAYKWICFSECTEACNFLGMDLSLTTQADSNSLTHESKEKNNKE